MSTARQRVTDFLDAWVDSARYGDIIYGIDGLPPKGVALSVADLRELLDERNRKPSIGPAARSHAMKALQAAGHAKTFLVPGELMDRAFMRLAVAQIEMIQAQAFALLGEEKPDAKS